MSFQQKFDALIGREGGYSNDPKDSGGETMWGITARVARAYGYDAPMHEMSRLTAVAIYRQKFWERQHLDEIDALSPAVADELLDSSVNCGEGNAGAWLQRSLNVLNQEGALYADIKADGSIGPVTVAALKEYLARRGKEGERVMLRALNSLQGAYYIGLAEARSKDERFVYGWFNNRVEIA